MCFPFLVSTVTAIYENGIFRPLTQVDLPEAARVVLTVQPPAATEEPDSAALEKVYAALAWRYDGEPDEAARVEELRR